MGPEQDGPSFSQRNDHLYRTRQNV